MYISADYLRRYDTPNGPVWFPITLYFVQDMEGFVVGPPEVSLVYESPSGQWLPTPFILPWDPTSSDPPNRHEALRLLALMPLNEPSPVRGECISYDACGNEARIADAIAPTRLAPLLTRNIDTERYAVYMSPEELPILAVSRTRHELGTTVLTATGTELVQVDRGGALRGLAYADDKTVSGTTVGLSVSHASSTPYSGFYGSRYGKGMIPTILGPNHQYQSLIMIAGSTSALTTTVNPSLAVTDNQLVSFVVHPHHDLNTPRALLALSERLQLASLTLTPITPTTSPFGLSITSVTANTPRFAMVSPLVTFATGERVRVSKEALEVLVLPAIQARVTVAVFLVTDSVKIVGNRPAHITDLKRDLSLKAADFQTWLKASESDATQLWAQCGIALSFLELKDCVVAGDLGDAVDVASQMKLPSEVELIHKSKNEPSARINIYIVHEILYAGEEGSLAKPAGVAFRRRGVQGLDGDSIDVALVRTYLEDMDRLSKGVRGLTMTHEIGHLLGIHGDYEDPVTKIEVMSHKKEQTPEDWHLTSEDAYEAWRSTVGQ